MCLILSEWNDEIMVVFYCIKTVIYVITPLKEVHLAFLGTIIIFYGYSWYYFWQFSDS